MLGIQNLNFPRWCKMGNTPYKNVIKDLTNDVITAIQMKFEFKGVNKRGKPINAYRIDNIDMLIRAFAGLATGDYFLIEIDYTNLNSEALAALLNMSDKSFVERVGHKYEILGTNGPSVEVDYPEVLGLNFKFKDCFIIQSEAFVNVLAHGLDATRDTDIIIHGQYVHLDEDDKDKRDSGITL